jgi:decaprenylphospho-beta-D-erythro-pentofuranosid-2-ulose 2-reductase
VTARDQLPRRVTVFGATSDIAVCVARGYARAGARLVLVGRDLQRLDAHAADLRIRGAAAVVCQQADFAQLTELPEVAARAWGEFDGIDVAIVAFGSLPDQVTAQASAERTAAALALNFVSPAVLLDELAPLFALQKSGVLAVITSVAGDRGRKSNYIYGSAKGGLQRFVQGLRHRLYAANVTVLDIRPGFVISKMTAHLSTSGPLWATPEKVATDILKAIDNRRATLYTPWFWRPIMMIVRLVPGPFLHRTSL